VKRPSTAQRRSAINQIQHPIAITQFLAGEIMQVIGLTGAFLQVSLSEEHDP
jgi:hypothetical protein